MDHNAPSEGNSFFEKHTIPSWAENGITKVEPAAVILGTLVLLETPGYFEGDNSPTLSVSSDIRSKMADLKPEFFDAHSESNLEIVREYLRVYPKAPFPEIYVFLPTPEGTLIGMWNLSAYIQRHPKEVCRVVTKKAFLKLVEILEENEPDKVQELGDMLYYLSLNLYDDSTEQ